VTSDYPRPENITVTVYKNGTAEYSAPVRANGTYKVEVLPGSGYTVGLDKHVVPGTTTPVVTASPFNLAYNGRQTVDLAGEKPWKVTNFAGSGSGSAQAGDANTARFNSPTMMTFSDGFLYVVSSGSNAIMKVDINNGNTQILIQNNGLSGPHGIYADGAGNLYVRKDLTTISKINIANPVPPVEFATGFSNAGSMVIEGNYLYVGDYSAGRIKRVAFPAGGAAENFSIISSPNDVVAEGGFLYVGEWSGNVIRKIQISDGTVTLLAGNGSPGSQDGTGTSAQFSSIVCLVSDGAGNLYVTQGNATARVRKIETTTGKVTTLSLVDGSPSGLPITFAFGICMVNGDIYVADRDQHKIKKLTRNW
jgi:hypothetical protein